MPPAPTMPSTADSRKLISRRYSGGPTSRGIGATLNTALGRYEYDTAAAILLSIILIVLIAEYASGLIRERLK